jgi:hypothetical protein
LGGEGLHKNVSALKVLGQGPLVLKIEVHLGQGEALGSEKGKSLRSEQVMKEKKKKLNRHFTVYDCVGRSTLR